MLKLNANHNEVEVDFKGRTTEVMAELTVAVIETIKSISEESHNSYENLVVPFIAIINASKKGR